MINNSAEADAPEFPEFTASPTSVDVSTATENTTVTLRLRVTDASGIRLGRYGSNYGTVFLGKPGSANLDGTRWSRISGDEYDGIYEATVEVPPDASPGNYYLYGRYWDDIWGNSSAASTSSNPGGEDDGGVTIINN